MPTAAAVPSVAANEPSHGRGTPDHSQQRRSRQSSQWRGCVLRSGAQRVPTQPRSLPISRSTSRPTQEPFAGYQGRRNVVCPPPTAPPPDVRPASAKAAATPKEHKPDFEAFRRGIADFGVQLARPPPGAHVACGPNHGGRRNDVTASSGAQRSTTPPASDHPSSKPLARTRRVFDLRACSTHPTGSVEPDVSSTDSLGGPSAHLKPP